MGDARQTELEQPALQALLQGHVTDAVGLIAQAERHSPGLDHPDQTASQGTPPSLVDTASYLLTLPYDDLPYPAELRRLVGAQLSLGVLLWERPEAIAVRLLRLTDGQFSCPSLETFLRHNPPGKLWFHFNPNRPQDRAALYAQTRCVEAAAAMRLNRLLEANVPTRRQGGYQGIEILYAAGHQCGICLESKRQYRWEEFDSLPKLPRHWGCRCMYVAWIAMLGR
jgi:hypothetical protein